MSQEVKSTINAQRIKASLQQLLAFGALILVYVFFLFAAPNFGGWNVFTDILLSSSAIGTMALGATFVISTGGIDLSVGTGMALIGVVGGYIMAPVPEYFGIPMWLGIPLTLLFGAAVGAVNGFAIAVMRIPPFIATLAMMLAARGLAIVLTDAQPIRMGKVNGFQELSIGEIIPGFPNAALIFLICAAIAGFLMTKTLLGRFALAMGSNEEATRLSGINVVGWKFAVYMTAGVFTAIGAILFSARTGSIYPGTGAGLELDAIAAVVIGGSSLAGGRANILGTVIGALLMQTLIKGLLLMGIASEWQFVVTGVVVLLAVYADNVRRERSRS